jgi:hypothetical protein
MGQHYCLHCEYVSVLSYFVLMSAFGLRWQKLILVKSELNVKCGLCLNSFM